MRKDAWGKGRQNCKVCEDGVLGLEEVPLVMVDRLVFEFFKSAGHSVSSIVGKGSFGYRWFVGLEAGGKCVFEKGRIWKKEEARGRGGKTVKLTKSAPF